ncbi:TauD/TfdA family dioxygenase [Paracraurococcus lichenis]|uniref:TauD/TfdA family dioxygenase n=1 Tax=Paracraurococcus lichenis TaxID=3064888 RepID=A0ABT9E6Q5_9PROT|nr:TauD/TfdA family dioxygenase [Paracraurococcus sp. LOR1-02]MDO9711853.1 TauD/TfdA family dioxygenase [Paracraurococcus sp. LOR1-02]
MSEYAPVTDASAWRGAEIAQDPGWIGTLTAAEIAELERALRGVQARGLPTTSITRADFPLPVLAPRLAAWLAEAQTGRGFFVVRGLPAERFSEAEREAIFWGLGMHLGMAVSQNSHGEMLGHVFDQGRTYGSANTRGYQTKARLDFHTDRCDLVGLLCQRRAKEGGLSSVVSTMAVHNEILRTRPDLLSILYRGFHYSEREAADNPDGVTPRPIPVFSRHRGVLSCRFIRNPIETGAQRRGVPLTEEEREALDLMSNLSAREDMRLDMMLEPGDMQFCNNYVTTHARTEFEDWPEPEKRRLMVRLWLTVEPRRPLAPDFGEHDGIPARLAPETAPLPA